LRSSAKMTYNNEEKVEDKNKNKNKDKNRITLLTGATGAIGGAIMRQVLQYSNVDLHIIVRQESEKNAKTTVDTLLKKKWILL